MQSEQYPQSRPVIAQSDIFVDYAINNKLTPFISMQNHYNLVYREEEREMFPTLKVRTLVSLHISRTLRSYRAAALRRRRDPMVTSGAWPSHPSLLCLPEQTDRTDQD